MGFSSGWRPLDEYAGLDSPLHRCPPRPKTLGFLGLITGFAFVREVQFIPLILGITALLYGVSRLPLSFLLQRLRYPGLFLLGIVTLLPLTSGSTIFWQWGWLTLWQEGTLAALLICGRFLAIFTLTLVYLGTATLLTTLKTLRSLGCPDLLVDLLLLSYRYLFQFNADLARMKLAMGMRGWKLSRMGYLQIKSLAFLAGTLLIRSYEQAERVYLALKLRGYSFRLQAMPDPTSAAMDFDRPQVITIHLEGLHVSYPDDLSPTETLHERSAKGNRTSDRTGDRTKVLQNINLKLRAGERLGVLGPNGAGKTTLFLTIGGVLVPQQGKVEVLGQLVIPGRFSPQVGLVWQNPDDQLFCASVRDDISFGPQNLGLPAAEIKSRVDAALRLTGMTELAARPPHHLSGGEKRMVAIAGVLAMQPQIVIYDEPSTNLDLRSRRRLIQFLQQSEQTLLIASHDLELILDVCDRIILLDKGQIVADGQPREIMSNPVLMVAHGLEVPPSLGRSA